jgi:hypothetical protein
MSTKPSVLGEAIEQIDGLAQEAFSQIAAVAKLALVSMETPSQVNIETLATALSLIWGKAVDTEAAISCAANSVGFGHKDAAFVRRHAARNGAQIHPISGVKP